MTQKFLTPEEPSSKYYENRALRMGGVHRSFKIGSQSSSNKKATFFFIPGVEAFSVNPNEIGPYTSTLGQIMTNDLHMAEHLSRDYFQGFAEFVNNIKISSLSDSFCDSFWTVYSLRLINTSMDQIVDFTKLI